MRFLPVIFFVISLSSSAQTDSLFEYSRLEKLCMQPNGFIHLSTDTIGSTDDLHVGVITANDLNSGKKQRSVCFIARDFNSIIFSQSNIQIGIEDLSSFVKALKKIKEAVDENNTEGIQRYQFTAGNLTVLSVEKRPNVSGKWDIAIYKRFKSINAPVPGTELSIREKKLDEFIRLLTSYSDYLGDDLYK